ncbi:MAG: sugar nucleotide-binding protein [Myxococcota bacterium]
MILILSSPVAGLEAVTAGCKSAAEAEQVEVEITSMRDVREVVARFRPRAVILAAWRDAENAERDPDRAFRISSEAAINMAAAALEFDAVPCYLSVADVFGAAGGPFGVQDEASPMAPFAEAAFRGEVFVSRASRGRALVVRSGPWVEGMQEDVRDGRAFPRSSRISPIRAFDLGVALVGWLDAKRTGVVHASSDGPGVWAEDLVRRLAAELAAPPMVSDQVEWAPSAVLRPTDPPLPPFDRTPLKWTARDQPTAGSPEPAATASGAETAVRLDELCVRVVELQPGAPWRVPAPGIVRVEEGKLLFECTGQPDQVLAKGDMAAVRAGRLLPVTTVRLAFSTRESL